MIFNIAGGVPAATQATPTISVNSAGLITASATQTAGYVAAGTKSATKQLTVQAAKTVTPSASVQTAVAASRYTTGAVKVAAIPSTYKRVATGTVTPALSQTTTGMITYTGTATVTGLGFTPSHVILVNTGSSGVLVSYDTEGLLENTSVQTCTLTCTYSSGSFVVKYTTSSSSWKNKFAGKTYNYVAWE